MQTPQLLQLAARHFQAGQLAEAETLCRQILAADANQPDAIHMLALIAQQTGHLDAAIGLLQRAIQLKPLWAEAHSNLGNVYFGKGLSNEAVACYRRAIQIRPEYTAAHYNLSYALKNLGRLEEAVIACQQAIRFQPNFAEAHDTLGNIQFALGRLDDAIASYQNAILLKPDLAEAYSNVGSVLNDKAQYVSAENFCRRAIQIQPNLVGAHINLGNALAHLGRFDEAIASHQRAIRLQPEFAAAYSNLGFALAGNGNLDQAIAAYRRAIQLKPDYAEAYNNLGNALKQRGNLEAATSAYERAIQLNPDSDDLVDSLMHVLDRLAYMGHSVPAVAAYERTIQRRPNCAEPYNNLANIYLQRGQLDQAITLYQRAAELKPQSVEIRDGLLFALIQHPNLSPESVLAAHREWNDQYALPLASQITSHENDPSHSRRLRIGFVSPDFYHHSVGFFFMPLLENFDRSNFEVFCYANVKKPDAVTEKMIEHCDVWRDIVGMTDGAAAQQIRDDGIDILVDLAGHTTDNRLLIFARKPAPIQVTYLGYPSTTGLTTIDYRLTDSLADPPGMAESQNVEQLWRLPTCAWCYQPPENAPEIQPRREGPITFGCFNNFRKIAPKMVEMWAELLQRVPESRLFFQGRGADLFSQEGLRARFVELGVPGERIETVGWVEDPRKHLEYYQQADIALDTYPYHGTTITCETLWMGVPVVTLMGQTHISRVGVSLLQNAGLPEPVAQSPEEYLKIASDLAGNPTRLAELRATLRDRLKSSPLLDAKRFTSEIESAFRQMWSIWCAGKTESELHAQSK